MGSPRSAGGYEQLLAWRTFQPDAPNTYPQASCRCLAGCEFAACCCQLARLSGKPANAEQPCSRQLATIATRCDPSSAEAAQRVFPGLHAGRQLLIPAALDP